MSLHAALNRAQSCEPCRRNLTTEAVKAFASGVAGRASLSLETPAPRARTTRRRARTAAPSWYGVSCRAKVAELEGSGGQNHTHVELEYMKSLVVKNADDDKNTDDDFCY
eukprot:1075061-Pleurochrysis_carterae.AAC.6